MDVVVGSPPRDLSELRGVNDLPRELPHMVHYPTSLWPSGGDVDVSDISLMNDEYMEYLSCT